LCFLTCANRKFVVQETAFYSIARYVRPKDEVIITDATDFFTCEVSQVIAVAPKRKDKTNSEKYAAASWHRESQVVDFDCPSSHPIWKYWDSITEEDVPDVTSESESDQVKITEFLNKYHKNY